MTSTEEPVEPNRRPRGTPPYNPGLLDLANRRNERSAPRGDSVESEDGGVQGKSRWQQRGYLPHRSQAGLAQFVTFNLSDAFPAALRAEWAFLMAIEFQPHRRRQWEAYLDRGRGAGSLAITPIARLVEEALFHAHPRDYLLHAWVIMPNHVHVLFTPSIGKLGSIVGAWKSWTAHQANRYLNRKHRFWAADFWDVWIRDSGHFARTQRYVENNPVRAGLSRIPAAWRWSSAAYRTSEGILDLSSRAR